MTQGTKEMQTLSIKENNQANPSARSHSLLRSLPSSREGGEKGATVKRDGTTFPHLTGRRMETGPMRNSRTDPLPKGGCQAERTVSSERNKMKECQNVPSRSQHREREGTKDRSLPLQGREGGERGTARAESSDRTSPLAIHY